MPQPGAWTFCYTPPGGLRKCIEIPQYLEWPQDIDVPDPVIAEIGQLQTLVTQLGQLQTLIPQVTDTGLKMQLTMALNDTVDRLTPALPAGFEFSRAATHDLLNDPGEFTGVPAVTGLFYRDGWDILNQAGYTVKQIPWRTSADLDGDIVDQDPEGGAGVPPPGLVTIWVGLAFPSPPHGPPDATPLRQ